MTFRWSWATEDNSDGSLGRGMTFSLVMPRRRFLLRDDE